MYNVEKEEIFMDMVLGTIKIELEFKNNQGSYADATDIELKIFSSSELLDTIQVTEDNKVDTGKYVVNYAVPSGVTSLTGQVTSTVGGNIVTGLMYFDVEDIVVANMVNKYLPFVRTAINVTNKDEFLKVLIPSTIGFIQSYCRKDFKNPLGQVDLPHGLKTCLAQLCQVIGKDCSYSKTSFKDFSFTSFDGIPENIIEVLDSFRAPSKVGSLSRVRR